MHVIGNAITNCHNVCPSLSVLANLNLTITKIVLRTILDISSNLLDFTFATKFQGNVTIFTCIIRELYKVIVNTIKQLIQILDLANIICTIIGIDSHRCRIKLS